MQESENHTELYDSLKKWRSERKLKPKISLTISIGDPQGGPDDQQNFLADPFRVRHPDFICVLFPQSFIESWSFTLDYLIIVGYGITVLGGHLLVN